jgi:hypothetical protein
MEINKGIYFDKVVTLNINIFFDKNNNYLVEQYLLFILYDD